MSGLMSRSGAELSDPRTGSAPTSSRSIGRTRRRVVCAVATVGLTGALVTAGWLPSGASDKATIYLVQGLPGAAVDFSLDGQQVAGNVGGAKVVGPFQVSAGQVKLAFSWKGSPTLVRTMTVKAGWNGDVVLHLPEAGTGEEVTTFKNDLNAVPKGKATLTVAHVAAVPPADIQVNNKVLFANVANGESLNLTVPADTYSVKVVPTGKTSPVFLGPLNINVKAGSLNRVYAFGRPSDKTMNVAVHTIAVRSTGSGAPKRVPTGSAGMAADARPVSLSPFLK